MKKKIPKLSFVSSSDQDGWASAFHLCFVVSEWTRPGPAGQGLEEQGTATGQLAEGAVLLGKGASSPGLSELLIHSSHSRAPCTAHVFSLAFLKNLQIHREVGRTRNENIHTPPAPRFTHGHFAPFALSCIHTCLLTLWKTSVDILFHP